MKTFIARAIIPYLLEEAKKAPVLAILGPRQSGKTTVARKTFPYHRYVSLEDLDTREFALTDPRGFLTEYESEHGIVLDEIQEAPGLLSYIQTIVDQDYRPGYFILTGSQNFLIGQAITQTLAGRISIHILLPLSIAELKHSHLLPAHANEAIVKGFYPIIYGKDYDPSKWYTDYIKTYIERDVRTLTNVTDLSTFQRFVKLCAGRIGQVLNLTSLGNDCGISSNTARGWLSVLEASYIVFLLQSHHKNFSKRLIKAPKLFFYDPGLACSLLGIETEEQIASHYLKGGLFETMIISDIFKLFYNQDKNPQLYFWRDKTGHEVDCLIEQALHITPIEIKAGQTVTNSYFDGLNYWNALAHADPRKAFVIYAGAENQKRSAGTVLSWTNTDQLV